MPPLCDGVLRQNENPSIASRNFRRMFPSKDLELRGRTNDSRVAAAQTQMQTQHSVYVTQCGTWAIFLRGQRSGAGGRRRRRRKFDSTQCVFPEEYSLVVFLPDKHYAFSKHKML